MTSLQQQSENIWEPKTQSAMNEFPCLPIRIFDTLSKTISHFSSRYHLARRQKSHRTYEMKNEERI